MIKTKAKKSKKPTTRKSSNKKVNPIQEYVPLIKPTTARIFDKEYIEQKENELNLVRKKLKNDFVGIDSEIDILIDNIKIWYICPELQLRPTIVCLWGLTGVGKTDLIRKLISYLSLQDKFLEIEMSNSDSNGTILDRLENSEIDSTTQGVLFLDEFQNYFTIDGDGSPVSKNSYNDIWCLLSDGKFHANTSNRSAIIRDLLDKKYYAYAYPDEEEKENKKSVFSTPFYHAKLVKRRLKLNNSVEEIMQWTEQDITKKYEEFLKDNTNFENETYTKLLIIISGNLDEAYNMASGVDLIDYDADMFHDMSRRINVLSIKTALAKRFKPEQIARLGNSHVIYPSLSKKDYTQIINSKCSRLQEKIKEISGVDVVLDESMYEMIYRNGVFPTQGVRPVLSTIHNVFSQCLPPALFTALNAGQERIVFKYNYPYISTDINGVGYTFKYQGDIEKIRKNKSDNKCYSILVHEMGHAFAHVVLFNRFPLEICVNSVQENTEGYIVGTITEIVTKSQILDIIKVAYAGNVASELVYGDKVHFKSDTSDMQHATNYAFSYFADSGNNKAKAMYSHYTNDESCKGTIFDVSLNQKVEALLIDQLAKTKQLFKKYRTLYKDMLKASVGKEKIRFEDMEPVFKKHKISVIPSSLNRNKPDNSEALKDNDEMKNLFLKFTGK